MLRTVQLLSLVIAFQLITLEGTRSDDRVAQPNFVFFITDDISPDDLGCYGNQSIKTPNLDSLAERGLVFDNAYLTISSCSPSRCSIITGRYPHNTGAPELHTPLPEDQHTFIQDFRAAGYYTLISGKNHMGKAGVLGFDASSDSHPAGSENWVKHLRERPKDRPFFFWLASHDAHHPFEPDEHAPTYGPEDASVPPMLYDGPLTRGELAAYYHEVSRTDHYAGEVMKELERQGIADNTYFVYCSDNGRPFPRCKTYLYDSGIKTPLIVLGPGVKSGRTPSLVSSIDFSATFLDLAGLPKPASVQGVSFAPVLRDPAATTRDVVFAERNWHVYQAHERTVRTGDWLYIWNAWPENHNVSGESSVPTFPAAKELWEMAEAGKLTPAQALLTKVPQPAEMLFNVKDDPYQFSNLAGHPQSQGTLERMRGLLDQWKEQTGDSVPTNPTPSRQPLHEHVSKGPPRGEFPGASHGATGINAPGPVRLDEPVAKQVKPARPNIVLVMADDMGYSDIGCYGGEIPTPNIDRLAADGLRFTQFYNTGRCCPTRASLLTGVYPHEAGVGRMVYADRGPGYYGHLTDECVTLGEVLQAAGYQTMMAGKWHVGHAPGQWPSDRGFEQFYGIHIHVDSYFKVLPNCPVYHNGQVAIAPTPTPPNALHPDKEWYTTDVFTDWALKFLSETSPSKKPFFLYVAYNSPHWPLEAPDANVEHFRGKYGDGWDKLRETKLARMKEMGLVTQETVLSPSENATWDSVEKGDQAELDFRRAIYSAQIERMDENVGRIVAQLEQMGVLDNTLILFLSDNGCCAEGGMFGYKWGENKIANHSQWRKESARSSSMGQAWACASNTPFRLYKHWVHEGGIATPLIARWPKVIGERGGLTHQPGHVVDIMATCCDVAGAEYPKQKNGKAIRDLRGVSLVPAFRTPSQTTPRTLFWEHETHAAIREGDWKLVSLSAADAEAWELYDMSKDRVELNDQAASHPEIVARLKKRWTDWARETDVLPFLKDRVKKKAKK